MKVKFDRLQCDGWFQCVQEWDGFEMEVAEGKVNLIDGHEESPDEFVREIADAELQEVRDAAAACPVDAIVVVDEDGDALASNVEE